MTARHRERWRQVARNIPDIRLYKTLLYVGAKVKKTYPSGMQLVPNFIDAGYTIDVIEIWGPNVKDLVKFNSKHQFFRTIFKGDVRKVDEILNGAVYDVVAWWHGPEHVPLGDIPDTLVKLEKMASHVILAGMPYGGHTQGPSRDNPYERHECTLTPEYFEHVMGPDWHTNTIGEKGNPPNNLMIWKWTDDVV